MPGDLKVAICQCWIESERGWGLRPDGFSLHSSEVALKTYILEYNFDLPDEVPDIYSRPDGSSFEVKVTETIWKTLSETTGMRFFKEWPKEGEKCL